MIESVQVRQRGAFDFQTHYENLCALQDACPLAAVKAHLSEGVLDLNGDRLRANDWAPVLNTLRINRSLEFVAFRSFYTPINTDNEKAVAIHRKKMPAIRSKEITYRLCKSLRECLTVSPTLSCLELQGLPLRERDFTSLTKGLFKNTALRHLSLEHCHIGDNGLDTICRGIKNSTTINSLNLTGCCLSWKGAESLSKVIKHQAMKRHNEAWRDSLRYRRPDLDRMPGIRRITINNNPLLGDQGAILLAEALKDDLWLKALDLQSCGISSKGAVTLLEVLKYNTTIVVLDVRRNPLIERDVLHSIMEQLMLNCNGQDTEYKWIKTEEGNEATKPTPKASAKKRRTKTLNISFGRKTTIRVPLSSARRRTKSAGSTNSEAQGKSVRAAAGLPWRTAARANRHRGFPPEHDPRCSSMYEDADGLSHMGSNPELSVIVTQDESNPEDTFGQLGKLNFDETELHNKAKNIRGVRVEFEQLRRRLKEEIDARKVAEKRNMELVLENGRLKSELVDLRVNRGSILEDDLILESIEASFKQFHSFLDLLRDAGLGSLITMAGLDQGKMPFSELSTSYNHKGGVSLNKGYQGNQSSVNGTPSISASRLLRNKSREAFVGDIGSNVQVSTSVGSFEEGLPIQFGPGSREAIVGGNIVTSEAESIPDPAMAGLAASDNFRVDLDAMKVDDLYERLVKDTKDVLNTDWDYKLAETQSRAKSKLTSTKRSTKGSDAESLQGESKKSENSKAETGMPIMTASVETLPDSLAKGQSSAQDLLAGGDPGSRGLVTPDLKSGYSDANYSMDGFDQSYVSERGELIQDIDLLESPSPTGAQDSDHDDF